MGSWKLEQEVWADFDEPGDIKPTNSALSSLLEEADTPPLPVWVNPLLPEEPVFASPGVVTPKATAESQDLALLSIFAFQW